MGNPKFAAKLIRLIDRAGKSPADVAKYMHVSNTTIFKWTNGRFFPGFDRILPLARYLGTTADFLLDHDLVEEPHVPVPSREDTVILEMAHSLGTEATWYETAKRKLMAEPDKGPLRPIPTDDAEFIRRLKAVTKRKRKPKGSRGGQGKSGEGK